METVKVSVIVPVYNAQQYLSACIESILNQTLTEIEVLLINDGSTDGSGEICDHYAGRDTRIKVIHQANSGVTAARRMGVMCSSASWLYFIDADDSIEPDCLEEMMKLVAANVDMVVFEASENKVCTLSDWIRVLFSFRCWAVWGKLFRRSLFDEWVCSVPSIYSVGEDFLMHCRLLRQIQGNIVLCDKTKYHYNSYNPHSVQKSHRKTYDYERGMLDEVCKALAPVMVVSGDEKGRIREAVVRFELIWLAGMIGLRYPIDYTDKWILDLRAEATHFHTSFKEKMVLASCDYPCLRAFFVMEKQIRGWGKRLLLRQ